MTLIKTEVVLAQLLEVYEEARETGMTEAPMIAIPAETAQAIKNAVVALEAFRIIEGAFTDSQGKPTEAKP